MEILFWADAQAQKSMVDILDLSDPIISPWVILKLLKTQKLVKATLPLSLFICTAIDLITLAHLDNCPNPPKG